ncbi:hypothetical protein KM043_013685 [Ampulex compressa]|nr:hypothetical protein KM043_013685 [Ampulex compressa]
MSRAKRNSLRSALDNAVESELTRDIFVFETDQNGQELRALSGQSAERGFAAWRVFISQLDGYHGKKLASRGRILAGERRELNFQLLAASAYVNPASAAEEVSTSQRDDLEDQEPKYEEDRMDDEDSMHKTVESSTKYEVIGTTVDPRYPCPEGVAIVIRDPKDRDLLLSELMKCGVIIYDITEDSSAIEEARWALKAIAQELETEQEKSSMAFERSVEPRYFVLISTVMTWAMTKPLDPEDPDLPLTEADYRKRKPHPNFKEHVQCEKDVVAIKKRPKLKDRLKTLVICCGVTYGDEEGPLHFLFKMAWENAEYLPIFGAGTNRIPLLHVRDLISILSAVLRSWPKPRYILAVEEGDSSQGAIVKKISRELGSGRVKNIPREEAFLLPEVTQRAYDLMTLDLRADPVYILDGITWHLDAPFLDSVDAIVREYRSARDLRPVKIIVLGPPAAGKTMVARYLAKHYAVHYVCVKSLITDAIQKLVSLFGTMLYVSLMIRDSARCRSAWVVLD